jgi:hypothetical protein
MDGYREARIIDSDKNIERPKPEWVEIWEVVDGEVDAASGDSFERTTSTIAIVTRPRGLLR